MNFTRAKDSSKPPYNKLITINELIASHSNQLAGRLLYNL